MKLVKKFATIRDSKQKGFTMIELIVVIAIAGILMAFAIPSYRTYERNAQVRDTAKDIRSLFWDAQSYALGPEYVDIESYRVTIVSGQGSNSDIVLKRFDEAGQQPLGRDLTTISLPEPVYIEDIQSVTGNAKPSISAVTVNFWVEDQEGDNITFNPDSEKIIIIVSSRISELKYEIVVDSITNNITWDRV